jgi:hypothetical protein
MFVFKVQGKKWYTDDKYPAAGEIPPGTQAPRPPPAPTHAQPSSTAKPQWRVTHYAHDGYTVTCPHTWMNMKIMVMRVHSYTYIGAKRTMVQNVPLLHFFYILNKIILHIKAKFIGILPCVFTIPPPPPTWPFILIYIRVGNMLRKKAANILQNLRLLFATHCYYILLLLYIIYVLIHDTVMYVWKYNFKI